MIQVNSRIRLNGPRIRQLTQAQVRALEQTAEALHSEVANAQVVPMDKGTLTGDGFFCDYADTQNGKVTLVHNTPYARRLYYHPEYKFQTTEHANAKGKWFEDWLTEGSQADFAKKAYKEIYRRIAGT